MNAGDPLGSGADALGDRASRMRRAIRVCWQVSSDGAPLGKTHVVSAAGELVSTPARRYVEGCIIRETMIETLADLLRDALTQGGCAHRFSGTFEPGMDGQVLHSGGRAPGATKEYLEHRPGPGAMCFDIDKGQVVQWRTHEEVAAGLRAAIPWLTGVGLLIMDSSGSCITLDGEERLGPGSYHVYVLVDSAPDIPALLEDAHRRCFLAGLGRVDVGGAGQFLERSPVDRALRLPTQPDFMVPHLGSPRLGRSREPSLLAGERVPAGVEMLSASEVDRYCQIVAQCKVGKVPEREAKLTERSEQAGRIAHAKLGGDLAHHIATARRAYETQTLPAGFVLPLGKGATCTVAELVADPLLAGTGWCLPDPLEPEYGQNKAKLLADKTPLVIRSQAHGGRDYLLDAPAAPSLSQSARSRVPGEDDGDEQPLTAERVLNLIDVEAKQRPITREFWRPLLWSAGLEATDIDSVLEKLVSLRVGKMRALRQEWKTYRIGKRAAQQADRSAKLHAMASVRGIAVINTSQNEEAVIRALEQVLVDAQDPELPLIRDANSYVRPVVDRPEWARKRGGYPVPSIAMLRSYDEAAARWLIDRYSVLEKNSEAGGAKPIKPDDFASKLLQNPLPAAPWVRGLITHPLVRADGRLIADPGLDEDSGLYLHLGGNLGEAPATLKSAIAVPEDPIVAQAQAHSFVKELLTLYDDYKFESEFDRAIALTARLSILVRKDLDIAPAYLLVGPERGTGKTTLAAIDAVIATGHDIPVASLEAEEEKAKQTLFAAFASSPSAILFDNLSTETSFSSTVLAAAITKTQIEARGFYTQKNVTANTNVALYLTGNAIVLDEDLQSRTLEVRFSAERPLRWKHPDWLAHARSIREDVRIKLQFIQRAFIRHGGDVRGVNVRFVAWGRRVRDPLLWAGLPDVGKRFREFEDANPNRALDGQVVVALEERFGSKKFTAGDVAESVGAGRSIYVQGGDGLRAMLQERRPTSLGKSGAQVLGGYFREHLKRWFQIEGRRIRLVETTEKGLRRWKVESEGSG